MKSTPKKITCGMDRCRWVVATAFCTGLSPILPGTFAALVGVALHLAVIEFVPQEWRFLSIAALFLLFSYLCLALNTWAEDHWNECDHQSFVLDEIAGYLCVPLLYRAQETWTSAFLGFILFRCIDMAKIFPANIVDRRMKNRWGVLLDDYISAAWAALILYIVL